MMEGLEAITITAGWLFCVYSLYLVRFEKLYILIICIREAQFVVRREETDTKAFVLFKL